MSYDDDYPGMDYGASSATMMYDHDSSHSSYGAPHLSHSLDKKTSGFDSRDLVTKDGMFLGMQLSPQTASMMRFIVYTFLPYISKRVENTGGKLASEVAQKHFSITDPQVLSKIGLRSANIIGVAAALHPQIFDALGIGKKLFDSLSDIKLAVEPVLVANKKHNASVLSARSNEVINKAVDEALASAWSDIMQSLGRAIAAIPHLLMLKGRHEERMEKLNNVAEWEAAHSGGIGKQKEYLANKLKKDLSAIKDKSEGFRSFLKEEKKAWFDGLEVYKKNSKNQEQARKNLAKEAESDYSYGKRKELFAKNKGRRYTGSNKEERESFNRIVEEEITRMYMDEHGVFDESCYRLTGDSMRGGYGYGYGYGGYGSNSRKTIEQQYREQYAEMEKAKFEQEKNLEKDGKGWDKDILTHGFASIGAVFGEIGGYIAAGLGIKKQADPIALDLILHLRRALDEDAKRESIPPKGERGEESGFAHYVHKIFQEHQQDYSKAAIGERYYEHLKDARWDDKEIFSKKDIELTPYEYAIKLIAKRIQDGRLDAIALVNLVGDRKIVQASGKSFGPRSGGTDEHIKEAILAEVDRECALFKPHHPGNQEKLSDEISNLTSSDFDYKLAFGASGRQGEERAFLFARLDGLIDNDKNLGEFTGLKSEEIKALRSAAQENKKKDITLSAAILELSEMAENDAKSLEKHKITAEEIDKLGKIAASIGEGRTAEDSIGHEDKKVIDTVLANVAMEEKGFFKKVEERCVKLIEQREEQKAEEKTEKEEGRKIAKNHQHDREAGDDEAREGRKFSKRHHKKDPVGEILKSRRHGYDNPDLKENDPFEPDDKRHSRWGNAMAMARSSAHSGRHSEDFKPGEGISL